MKRAFLGLGSNLEDREKFLEDAVIELASKGDVVAVSPTYETEPIGGPRSQANFLNLVVELHTLDSARQLLERCRQLEEHAGRVRTVRFGPRTLDADVLLFGNETVNEDDLEIPHPRMWERRFVLAPLRDLAPELISEADVTSSGGEVKKVGRLSFEF